MFTYIHHQGRNDNDEWRIRCTRSKTYIHLDADTDADTVRCTMHCRRFFTVHPRTVPTLQVRQFPHNSVRFFPCRTRTQRALHRTFAVVPPSVHGPLVVPHGHLQQLCGVLDMAVFGVPVSVIR